MTKLLKKNILITLFATLLLSAFVALAFSLRPTGIVKADEANPDSAELFFSLDFDDEKDLDYIFDYPPDGNFTLVDSKLELQIKSGDINRFIIRIPAEDILKYDNVIFTFDMEGYEENNDLNVFDYYASSWVVERIFCLENGSNLNNVYDVSPKSLLFFSPYRFSSDSNRYFINLVTSELKWDVLNQLNGSYDYLGFTILTSPNVPLDFNIYIDNFKCYGMDLPFAEFQSDYAFNDKLLSRIIFPALCVSRILTESLPE